MLTADAGSDQRLPPSPRVSHVRVVLASLAFVGVATVTQLGRQSGVSMWRTVWAEDGALFYTDAWQHPLREIALRPYAGYALLGPRTLAAIGVHLPPDWYSAFAAISSALLASVLALFVYFASAPLLRSPIRQGVLTAALVWWPVLPYEITGVIANTHWVMVVPCLLAVLLPVDRPWAIAVRLPIVVIAPLSSPLCVLFVPIALWHGVRFLRGRAPWPTILVPGVYTVAACVQVIIWHFADKVANTTTGGGFIGPVAKIYSTRVATEFVLGTRVTAHLWGHTGYWLAVVCVLGLLGALGWRWLRASMASRWFIATCTVASVVIYALSLSQRRDIVDAMVIGNDSSYNFAGLRYQLFPAALLLLALLVPLDLPRGAIFELSHTRPRPRPFATELRRERWVVAVAAAWFLVAFVPSFRLNTARSTGPDWVAQIENAERDCKVHPDATEVVAISPAPDWVVGLTCAELGDGP